MKLQRAQSVPDQGDWNRRLNEVDSYSGDSQQVQQQAYGGYQTGQPQDFGAQEDGVFYVERGYPSGGQHSSGYGSYGAYQVDIRQVSGHSASAPKEDEIGPDERIRELICERLIQHPAVDASEVTVQVSQGRVVLDGIVPVLRMKHELEAVADGCWGVKDVENRLRVQTALSSESGNPTRGATGRAREADMSPLETGTGISTGDSGDSVTISVGTPAEMELKSKGSE